MLLDWWDDRAASGKTLSQLAAAVGIVAVPTLDMACHVQEDIVEAAKLSNAHGFITALPQGYDTKVCAQHKAEHVTVRFKAYLAVAMSWEGP